MIYNYNAAGARTRGQGLQGEAQGAARRDAHNGGVILKRILRAQAFTSSVVAAGDRALFATAKQSPDFASPLVPKCAKWSKAAAYALC